MLIALALLDNVPTMTIAFDNAAVLPQPVKMGVRPLVSDFVCARVTRSYSKLSSALPRLDDRAGGRETRALWDFGSGPVMEKVALPATSS